MKIIQCVLFGTILLLPVMADQASARSATASTGRARLGSQDSCFSFSVTSGSVTSTCGADFIVPLTTDHSGTKAISFTSRLADDDTPPACCRAVANDPYGTAYSASSFVYLPHSDSYQSQSTGSVSVPHMGVFFADCILSDGAKLDEFDYTD